MFGWFVSLLLEDAVFVGQLDVLLCYSTIVITTTNVKAPVMWQVASDTAKVTPGHGKGSSVFDSMDRSKYGKVTASSTVAPTSAPRSKKVITCIV